MRFRRGAVAGAAAVIVALAISGCSTTGPTSQDGGSGEPVAGGDFVSALYLEPLALDPQRQGYWETYRVSRNIFEGLTTEDTSGATDPTEVLPSLATEWSVDDSGTVWDFTLRDDVAFHDGSPFDAEALDKNVRRISDETYEFYDEKSAANLSVWFGGLVSGEIVDDTHYRFTFDKPFLGFPRILAQSMATLNIGNPAVWEEYGNDGFADHPEGTGPYTFVSRTTGDRIVLEKNSDYWGEEPKLDSLTFRIIPNNQTRLAALLSGEVDQISYVQPDDVDTLEAQGFQVPEGTGASLLYLSFNFRNPDIKDERVRQALIHGLDREKLTKEVYNGYAQPQYSFQPPGNEAYDPDARDFEYDPEKATELLAEAGYTADNPLSFTIVIDVANQNAAEWLQAQYKEIGVETEIVSLDRTSYIARAYSDAEPTDGITFDEYGGSYAEWLYQGYSGLTAKGLDTADFPEISAALDAALTTADESQRIPLWQKAEELVRKNAVVIPIANLTRYYGLAPDVKDFVWPATNWYDLSTVWLDR